MAEKKKRARRKGKSHKFKGRNNRPSRDRYWLSKRLEQRKIARLVRYCGLSEAAAYLRWHATRQGRIRK